MPHHRQSLIALLVDDEAYFRRFVGQVLKQQGVGTVLEARNGREGVQLYQAHRPQLVVMDINMPQLDGMGALNEIRRLSPDVPIIMLTSIAEEAVVEECVKNGATYFIRKDVSAATLQTELKAMLEQFCPNPEKQDAASPIDAG
jgi:two-component system chemotaxis response regulator CheY